MVCCSLQVLFLDTVLPWLRALSSLQTNLTAQAMDVSDTIQTIQVLIQTAMMQLVWCSYIHPSTTHHTQHTLYTYTVGVTTLILWGVPVCGYACTHNYNAYYWYSQYVAPPTAFRVSWTGPLWRQRPQRRVPWMQLTGRSMPLWTEFLSLWRMSQTHFQLWVDSTGFVCSCAFVRQVSLCFGCLLCTQTYTLTYIHTYSMC